VVRASGARKAGAARDHAAPAALRPARGRRALRDHLAIDSCRQVSLCLPFVTAYGASGWTALGDPTRRAIFEHLADRPRAVGELARELPVSRPAVSQHLKVLKDAALVIDRRAGNRRIYQLDPDGVGALRAELERFWSKSLAAYKEVVEQPTEEVR
jgi:DNA-binding transcriptional ArsR family regulator